MTKETMDEIFAEYKMGISNKKFATATKFTKRSIVRGCRVKTGDVEKERPVLILTDTEYHNVDLLTNHLSVAIIHTRPNNDLSIPILLDFYGDNSNRISFVDPITEAEVLYFENFPKMITRTHTCPDSVFNLVLLVKSLVQQGLYDDAVEAVRQHRLKFMRAHGIVRIGYILTKECMKWLEADGTEYYTDHNITGWTVEWLQNETVSDSAEEEIEESVEPDEELVVTDNGNNMGSAISDALKKALGENPIITPILKEDVTKPTVEVYAAEEEKPAEELPGHSLFVQKEKKKKGKKGKKTTKRATPKRKSTKNVAVTKLTDEELINFMIGIESSNSPKEAREKLCGDTIATSTGFRCRYQAISEEMKRRNLTDMIIPWDFDDPNFKNHWRHRSK